MSEHITENGITYKVETGSDGTKSWYLDNKQHRVDGPAIERADGTKFWYLDNKQHRVDGPAIERADGTKCWYLNDERHRVDGPAIEWAGGSKFWFLDGKRHRVNGPAIEWADGTKYWHLNDEQLTEEEFQEFHKAYKHIKKHPEEALRYMNHKHLGSVARVLLGD